MEKFSVHRGGITPLHVWGSERENSKSNPNLWGEGLLSTPLSKQSHHKRNLWGVTNSQKRFWKVSNPQRVSTLQFVQFTPISTYLRRVNPFMIWEIFEKLFYWFMIPYRCSSHLVSLLWGTGSTTSPHKLGLDLELPRSEPQKWSGVIPPLWTDFFSISFYDGLYDHIDLVYAWVGLWMFTESTCITWDWT